MASAPSKILRIASASGSVTDRRHGFAALAKEEVVSFIVGDWMSEYNMTTRGAAKVSGAASSAEFEECFLESITPALPDLERRGIKVAVNAGASDTKKLYDTLYKIVQEKGLKLKIAWVEGDEVSDLVQQGLESGDSFQSLTTGKGISDWAFEPIYAQCYLGSWGIVEAFKEGADIVLCGRVADACPTIACAAYTYQWGREDLSQLAHAFVAGHFIECSTYVTGGNFTGFKSLPGKSLNLSFPVVEIDADGTFIVTKQLKGDGIVSVDTCKAQLLYEIQGPFYYNSDVVAELSNIKIEHAGENRVRVTNVGFKKAPPTTKVGITAKGGFQAEVHYFGCGLDIEEKAALLERQIRHHLNESSYHTLKFRVNGRCPSNPSSQDSATVDFRIFAQSKDESALSIENFLRPCTDVIMESYPGATFAVDNRQALPKPYYEYWVALLPQSAIRHVAHMPFANKSVAIPPPTDTEDFLYQQPSYETENPLPFGSWGPTTLAPLGYVVHSRSGDKGSDANVGFFVRNTDEWDWLRSILTLEKIKNLLENDYEGKPIDRFELPHIQAVHFLLKDHLDRGVSSSSTYDVLGKNLAEYLRSKHVEIPNKFLERGRI
ncbi:hypothetical protein VE01_00845 [Pseudogymnoascus verrucosus]|uniref:DUF1446-domain-containing protein n=1 Tax=Pseudogymnoascus verrucosus TaxID=342668 RepID=A0A2P2SVN2_9PEZI|nr:uncharacterized protein VE01_00845 [Pseudogymnoascus verrucosus]OBU00901.2 hypothetical protein VE01_00845 [Pseudogymnoascus verrucosus]